MKHIVLHCALEAAKDIDKLTKLIEPSSFMGNNFMMALPRAATPTQCTLNLRPDAKITPAELYSHLISDAKRRFGITAIECRATSEEGNDSAMLVNGLTELSILIQRRRETVGEIQKIPERIVLLKQIISDIEPILSTLKGDTETNTDKNYKKYTDKVHRDSLGYITELGHLPNKKTELEALVISLDKRIGALQDLLPPVSVSAAKVAPEGTVPDATAFHDSAPKSGARDVLTRMLGGHRKKKPSVLDKTPTSGDKQIDSNNQTLMGELSRRLNSSTPSTSLPFEPQERARANPVGHFILYVNKKESAEEARDTGLRDCYILKNDPTFHGQKILYLIRLNGEIQKSTVKPVQTGRLNTQLDALVADQLDEQAKSQYDNGEQCTLKLSASDLDSVRRCTIKPEIFASPVTQDYKSKAQKDAIEKTDDFSNTM